MNSVHIGQMPRHIQTIPQCTLISGTQIVHKETDSRCQIAVAPAGISPERSALGIFLSHMVIQTVAAEGDIPPIHHTVKVALSFVIVEIFETEIQHCAAFGESFSRQQIFSARKS